MIEVASPADALDISDLLRLRTLENHRTLNAAKVLGAISQHINDGGCLISRHRGLIVGTVAIYRDAFEDSDDTALFTRWFFVHPDHRNEGHATRFIGALKTAANIAGLPLFARIETKSDARSAFKSLRKHLLCIESGFIFMPEAHARAA